MKNMKNTMATDEQLRCREAQHTLANEVMNLMNHNEQEGLLWKGTSIDLMEALHVAYETGDLLDEKGICLSFTHIVSCVCRVLHVSCPRNPYECASRGRRRKGMFMSPYMERYRQQLRHAQTRSVLWSNIGK